MIVAAVLITPATPAIRISPVAVASFTEPVRATMRRMGFGATPAGASAPRATSIERAAFGDESAFAEFYDEVSPAVFGTTLKVLRNQAIAEEVTQEVFLELWKKAATYEPTRGAPKAWATTIAHRRAVDRVRSEESSRARDEADARIRDVDRDVVSDAVGVNDERTLVLACLAQLSTVQREAVSLAYYGGHTYREVATLLDVPEGTIKTRIRDGLTRLRELMKDSI